MAVISNKPTEPTKEILRHLKVLKNFSHVIGGSSNFPLKPDPASLMFVLSETMSLGKDSWMVGDNYTDLESGRRAGMKTCFVKYGFGDPRSEPFDLEVESFAELVTEFKTSDK
jgi:phosphoglycolate phosphatase